GGTVSAGRAVDSVATGNLPSIGRTGSSLGSTVSRGKPDDERAALTWTALRDVEVATEQPGELAGHRQPQTRTSAAVRRRRIGTPERLEDTLAVLARDPPS